MLMSRVVAALVAMALVFGGLSGRMTEVSNGLVEGAAGAVSLMISIGGAICLWSGLMEVMARSGLAEQEGRPPDEVMLLIVLNTASLQLIPTTIAAVRAGLGAVEPYDILPAVWLASGISVAVGILACKLMQRGWRQP